MYPNTSVGTDNLNEDERDKKAYQSPDLVLYGNISEITQAVDMMGMADGGGGMMNKT
ncbi:MAG: hypothetical protein SF097_01985 [Acidobacteriota bacterium]|nr:hypothetical protein [Acidobacteriota bacterium]